MSYSNFKKACQLMQDLEDFDPGTPKSAAEISAAEKDLGLKFSKQCIEFYSTYDYTSFSGCEIFGIASGAGSPILEGNIVASTIDERQNYSLPDNLVSFFNCGDGSLLYFDYDDLNSEGEPRIVRWAYDPYTQSHMFIENIADDFGDFLINLIDSL